jgi:O-succinylbenzoic acid--CoA ligase
MTAALTVYPQGMEFTREQLVGAGRSDAPPYIGENARAALEFCAEWLAGGEAFVVHSSGSTGAPKPVRLARAQMEASARATGQALGLRPGMVALACLPTRYIAGRMMLVRGLELGLPLAVVEPEAQPLRALPPALEIAFASFVPLQAQATLAGTAAERARLDRLHALLVGGGPVSAALEEALQGVAAPVYHTYGMTETATHVALRRINGPQRSDAFTPLPGVETRLDQRGCLALRGAVTGGAWLQTNDVAELRHPMTAGAFVWLGRWDNVINSGGVKVQVEQVEAQVERLLPGLLGGERRFFVAGLPDERLGQAVTLVIEGAALPPEQEAALLAALRAVLAPALGSYAAPRRIVAHARFAETPTGKVDRPGTLAEM